MLLYCQESLKKPNKFLHKEISEHLIPFLRENNFEPMRTYLHGIIANRIFRIKSIDYKAKGKSGVRKKDYCVMRLELVEKVHEQIFLEMVKGKNPIMFRYLI